ncbi:MAG: hypothetical protein PVI30_08995 [Myxococcales bacterium]
MSLAPRARADQRRDFMLDLLPEGSRFIVDYFGTGAIFRLEHRKRIYGPTNDVSITGAVVPAYPLADAFLSGELRLLFLGLGGTVGYRHVWRELAFEPGEDGSYCEACDRKSRREQDPLFGETKGSFHYPYAEARATMWFPFNEHVVMTTQGALRYEGRQDRSFDWFFSTVYDRGMLARWETTIFFKHRDWGAIGPYVQLLDLPRGGDRYTQWAWGLNASTRLGLLRRDDFLFFTLLIRPGDAIFGQHSYYAPVRSLLVYRMIFDL